MNPRKRAQNRMRGGEKSLKLGNDQHDDNNSNYYYYK